MEVDLVRALFVTSNLNNGYQTPIFEGLSQFARDHDIQLFTFALTTATSDKQVQRFLLRQIAQMPKADVLIINSATFEFIDSALDMLDVQHAYQCKKLIIIGREHPDLCSITINNKTGIELCVRHFIETHHFDKIGFISGPNSVKDAVERKSAFLTAMQTHNAELRNEWLLDGDFTFDAGYQAISRLLPNQLPQAIVCADDYIAFGAQKAAADLGYDIKVAGFDNVDQAQYSNPSLTTVHQPLYEMGWKAGEQILKLDERPSIVVDCELIVRESCGCQPDINASNSPSNDDNIIARLSHTLRSRMSLHKDSQQWLAQIVELYRTMGNTSTVDQLLEVWKRCVFNNSPNYYALVECNGVLTEHCLAENSDIAYQNHALELSSQLDAALHKLINQEYTKLNNDRSDQFSGVLGLTRDLDTSTDQLQLIHSIERAFEAIGIKHYCLCITSKQRSLFYELSNLHTQMQITTTTQPVEDTEFPMVEAIPSFDIWPDAEKNICILPLILDRFYFGQLLLITTDQAPDLLEHIRHNLAVALLSHSNIEQSRYIRQELENTLEAIEQHNQQLVDQTIHDELTGLLNRRGFLDRAPNMLALNRQHLYFADMDNLKLINDKHGHATGDQALNHIAQTLQSTFSEEALCARLGGDEFVVLDNQLIEDPTAVINNKLNKIRERHTLSYPLGISIGKASSDEAEEITELMAIADQRLYQVKSQRRMDGNAPRTDH